MKDKKKALENIDSILKDILEKIKEKHDANIRNKEKEIYESQTKRAV